MYLLAMVEFCQFKKKYSSEKLLVSQNCIKKGYRNIHIYFLYIQERYRDFKAQFPSTALVQSNI